MATCVLPHTSPGMRCETSIAITLLTLALAGCSHKTLDSSDLSSTLRATASLAAEADVFIEYLGSGRPTSTFARGHAEYLVEELEDERSDLEGASVAASLRPALERCRTQQEQLGRELRRLQLAVDHSEELPEIAKQIRGIGQAAAQTRRSL